MKHDMGEQGTPDGVRIPGKDERHGCDPSTMVEKSVNGKLKTSPMAALFGQAMIKQGVQGDWGKRWVSSSSGGGKEEQVPMWLFGGRVQSVDRWNAVPCCAVAHFSDFASQDRQEPVGSTCGRTDMIISLRQAHS